MIKKILLATHGTPGAQKAEKLAAQWARDMNAELHVLSIINEDWGLMTGDDWLNTSTTRNKFGDYVMGEIDKEIGLLHGRLAEDLQGLDPKFHRRGGRIEEVLSCTAKELDADVIIMGAWQKKQAPGFKARFENKQLHPLLPCPVVVAP